VTEWNLAYGTMLYKSSLMSCPGGSHMQMYLPVWCHGSPNIRTSCFWRL